MAGCVYNVNTSRGSNPITGESLPYLIDDRSVAGIETSSIFMKLMYTFNVIKFRSFSVLNKFVQRSLDEEYLIELNEENLSMVVSASAGILNYTTGPFREKINFFVSHYANYNQSYDVSGVHFTMQRSIVPILTKSIKKYVEPSGDGFISTMKTYIKIKYSVMTDEEITTFIQCIQEKRYIPKEGTLKQISDRGIEYDTVVSWLRTEITLYPDIVTAVAEKHLARYTDRTRVGTLLKTLSYLRDRDEITNCFNQLPDEMKTVGLEVVQKMAKKIRSEHLKMKRHCFLKYRHHMIHTIVNSSPPELTLNSRHITLIPEISSRFPLHIYENVVNPTSKTAMCHWAKRNGYPNFDKFRTMDDLFDRSGILSEAYKNDGWMMDNSVYTDGTSVVFRFKKSRKRRVEENEDDFDC